jgi:DNA-directed RNA polymerase subunit beta'
LLVRPGDKHIEVIGRQMMHWVKIKEVGDSDFLVEKVVDFYRFMRENAKLERESKAPTEPAAPAPRCAT